MLERLFTKNGALIFLIFLMAISLRITGPYFQVTHFFHRQFFISGSELYGYYKSDELIYNFTAKSILEGRGFSLNVPEILDEQKTSYDDDMIDFFRDVYCSRGVQNINDQKYWHHNLIPPLYPSFLAFFYFVFGVGTLSYFIPQLILGALTCLLVYFLAKEMFDEKIAILAAFATSVYPELVFWTYSIRPEILYIFLLIVGFLLIIKGNKYNNIYLIFGGGVILGLACLTRVTLLMFFPFLIVWQFWIAKGKMRFKFSAILLISILLVLLPWAVRNYIVFNEFTFFTSEVSVILVDHMSLTEIKNSRSPYAFLSQFYNYFVNDAGGYFSHSIKRLITYLSPYTSGMDKFAKIYKFISWLIIFPAGFIGIVLSIFNSWRKYSLLILFIFYYIVIHAATCVDIGLVYRYPLIPFMAIFAFYAYQQLFLLYVNRNKGTV
ncbi:hypothetical protein A2230_08125 [candidate division WOR-1 bacterium RIFOXYA2_FULL_36_21]|uniref:Glycosyltransferase RgtA/B/C/D-like domain-containing protein n=1 Tax=candidate division WOR-1 bacterium RIFOXYB2_FULL_36_35 TaxID=1802578 RepID=A0A1F4SA68_UNCSA|nr:MAG: hypothetical protein A2230_08125 [candidate division WOR-1 bacterium RIFOXYA2_FULL_36_21]OGC14608.1 MAG: hypothetical protein A2282_04140 [candidate division WOR-1 bacterium RIFOXYA12_FULL_36_13]OGC16623.1 MAG: hypothetical protein A2290_03340 [candidate division WOR-1 bacterium RIFOXYB2_FULL_36_35]